MTASSSKRCIFFDRDGVINVSPGKGYVLSWEQFEFTPGIQEVLKMVKQRDWMTALVTSQRGVGKGLMSLSDLEEIHSRMQNILSTTEAQFDAIYAYTETLDCPHQPKPQPEMLITASKDLGIHLSKSWMIGDSDRDIEMGQAAKLKGTIRFLSDKTPQVEADFTVADAPALSELLRAIL